MEKKSKKISNRLLDFGVEIIKITIDLNKNSIGSNISKQLLRAGTSAGANYEEACGAEGRADFIHKMQIILKELRESMYWLRLIQKSKILKFRNFRNILNDADQLCCIIAKSVITAKNNQKI